VSEALPYRATAASAAYDEVAGLPVSVLLDNVRSAYNVGAFFRTMDAVGGSRIFVSGITPLPAHRGVAKTALGAEVTLPWSPVVDVGSLLDELHESGVTIAAIETSVTAVDLFDWQPSFPVCVVFGHEVNGIGAPLMARADVQVRLPMLGRKQSLNVATAGGVVLYELLRKYRTSQLPFRRA
jgi:23S rRNA (guanosine2251-2'-O)-methyltransferase